MVFSKSAVHYIMLFSLRTYERHFFQDSFVVWSSGPNCRAVELSIYIHPLLGAWSQPVMALEFWETNY